MAGASRYETILKLASGGMATVWVGTVRGALGFRQLVAIKKPHPHLLSDPGFRGELVAEARLASMIHHANVVDVRDVEIDGDSISLVMDYIEGATLGDLLVAASRRGERLSPRAAVRIVLDACAGLHAAHELVDERNRPVGLVHRDVSPQNVLVGVDGIARVADFGVAKFARKNMQSTSAGSLKGKLAYMAPEYVRAEGIDRRFDVFALGVVLWEALVGRRCFRGESEAETVHRLLEHEPEPVSSIAPELAALDTVIACALSKNREERFQNAAAMAAALEASAQSAGLLVGHGEVARAVRELVGVAIEERRALVRAKQANEPSVASLMGAPPIVIPEAAPSTLVDPPSAVPSTQPMTPRMEPARTLASPGVAPAAIANTTLRSPDPNEPDAPQLAFHDPSRRAIAAPEAFGLPASRPRRWLVPVLVAALATAVIGGAAVAVSRSAAPAGSEPAVSASTSAPASAAPPTASAAPPAPLPSATATASSTTEAIVPAKPVAKTTRLIAAPVDAAVAASTAPPGPTSSASARRPPPNPYGAEDQPR